VRAIGATAADVRALSRQLQRPPGAPQREPDLTLHFVPGFEITGLHKLGLNWAGHTGDAFYLLDARDGSVVAQVAFDTIGAGGEMRYPHGRHGFPLLADVVSATLCARGHVALHGSAFCHAGNGVLVAGWEKGGKTEALLAFASRGARFVGDEMMVLSADGGRMLGVPLPISVWDWQARQVGNLVPKPGVGQRAVSAGIGMLDAVNRRARSGRSGARGPFRVLDKAMPTLARQRRTWHWPDALFPGPLYDAEVAVDRVFLMTTHADDRVAVRPCAADRFAARMAASNEYERTHLLQYYRAFRFAFPERRNPHLDAIESRQAQALREALASRTVFEVLHPYPCSLDDLYEAMRPYVEGET
jgi:hypothetical protein